MRPLLLILLCGTLFSAQCEESRGIGLLQQGITALKAADADRSKLLEAIGFLTRAADRLGQEGNEQSATDANALLYWCRKKLTIDEIGALQRSAPEVASKADAVVSSEVRPEDAKAWLERADDYASRVQDPLLKAVRYFEVADRFKNTPEGFKALDLSLKLMQDVKVGSPKVAGSAQQGDGKVYVQSVPPGASVLVESGGELRECGVRTPGMVMLPKGRTVLVLRLEGHRDGRMAVLVGDAILKPEAISLEKLLCTLDVIDQMKGGWRVFLDGKAATDKMGKPAVTPCTLQLPEGKTDLILAKEGFVDVSHSVMVQGATMVVEVPGTATAGKSDLLEAGLERFAGKWIKSDTDTIFVFKSDGTVSAPTAMIRGTWKVIGDEVLLAVGSSQMLFKIVDDNHLTGTFNFRRKK